MNPFYSTLFLLGAALLQSWLRTPAFMGSMDLPVLLSALYCIVLRSTLRRSLYAGALAGFLYDSLAPTTLGISLPFYLLIAAGVYLIRDEIFSDQLISYAVLGLAGSMLKMLYFLCVSAITDFSVNGTSVVWVQVGSSLVLGLLVAPLVYALAFKLFCAKRRKRGWA